MVSIKVMKTQQDFENEAPVRSLGFLAGNEQFKETLDLMKFKTLTA